MENPVKEAATIMLSLASFDIQEQKEKECVVRREAYLGAEKALRLKRKRMLKKWQYEAQRGKRKKRKLLSSDVQLQVLIPFDVQLQVLACLEVDHLFRSCLLVCKQWKDAILSSPSFARRQYRHSQRHNMWATLWKRSYSLEKWNWGSYTVLELQLEQPGRIKCTDQGIICLRNEQEEKHIRVGNPLQNNWKLISAPFQRCSLYCLKVDSATSPASFQIAAVLCKKKDPLSPCIMHTEIFDSKSNTWNKGNTITLDGPLQDKLEANWVGFVRLDKRIITYNFEHKRWSIKGYVSADDNAREQIIFCEGEPILVSYSGPWIMLWKEHSCCKGIIKWALITKLDIEKFLAQHYLKVQGEQSKYTGAQCMGYVIVITVWVFCCKMKKTALLTYDTRKDCWKFEGSIKGGWPSDFDMRFTPSLITI